LTPGGPGDAELVTANVEFAFELDTSYGPVRVLWVSGDDTKQFALDVGAGSTLDVTLFSSANELAILQTFPGSLLALLPSGLIAIDQALPGPVGLIASIPLPSLLGSGITHATIETALVGPALDHLASFGVAGLVP